MRRLIDQGPFTGEEALAAGLIDCVRYRDESLRLALRRAGAGAATVPLDDYADSVAAPAEPAASVALIRAVGPDPPRRRSARRRDRGRRAGRRRCDDIAEDAGLDAVLLRIDSGGGSAVASETIRRAVAARCARPASR